MCSGEILSVLNLPEYSRQKWLKILRFFLICRPESLLCLSAEYIYSAKSRLYCTVNFPGKSSVIMSFADSVSETSHGSYGCERHQLYFATPASMCLCHSLGRAKKGRPSQCHCRDLPGEYGGSPHVRRISTHRNQPASSCLVLFAGSQAYLLDIEEFVECRLRCL